jgi:hypothetical protein
MSFQSVYLAEDFVQGSVSGLISHKISWELDEFAPVLPELACVVALKAKTSSFILLISRLVYLV